MGWRSRGFAALAACALCAASAGAQVPGSAQMSSSAGELFERGVAAMREGKHDSGCPALDESYRLEPQPGALFAAAHCHADWGKVHGAVKRYEAYVALFPGLPAEQQARHVDRWKLARLEIARLSPLVPRVELVLPEPVPEHLAVTIDGEPVPLESTGQLLPLDPGPHALETVSDSGALHERCQPTGRHRCRGTALSAERGDGALFVSGGAGRGTGSGQGPGTCTTVAMAHVGASTAGSLPVGSPGGCWAAESGWLQLVVAGQHLAHGCHLRARSQGEKPWRRSSAAGGVAADRALREALAPGPAPPRREHQRGGDRSASSLRTAGRASARGLWQTSSLSAPTGGVRGERRGLHELAHPGGGPARSG